MRRRILAALAVGTVLALATISTASGLLYVRPLPTIDGHYRLLGLHARAEVVRDDLGIPRVYAGDVHDLFFLQGYVTAQDRFAQMEAMRTVAGARAGDPAAAAERAVGDLREALDAYAAGVTKFIEQHAEHRALPAETRLSGRRPTPWRPADTLAIVSAYLERIAEPSICVATGADRTFKGMPVVAAELQLDAPAPGWYEVGLDGGGIRALGISLPGVPGIVAGHNRWVAWGVLSSASAGSDPARSLGGLIAAAHARNAEAFGDAMRGAALAACMADLYGRGGGVEREDVALVPRDRSAVVAGRGARGRAMALVLDTARGVDVETIRVLLERPAPAAASARVIVDLADLDASKAALSTGQSAHRASRHYADQVPLWEAGQLHRLASSRRALGRIEGQLVLRAR